MKQHWIMVAECVENNGLKTVSIQSSLIKYQGEKEWKMLKQKNHRPEKLERAEIVAVRNLSPALMGFVALAITQLKVSRKIRLNIALPWPKLKSAFWTRIMAQVVEMIKNQKRNSKRNLLKSYTKRQFCRLIVMFLSPLG